MTIEQAKQKLAGMAAESGVSLEPSGMFFYEGDERDYEGDERDDVVCGWGIVPSRRGGGFIIVSVPGNEQ